MSVARLKRKAERKVERGLAAVNGAAARGAASAKAQVGGWIERMAGRLTRHHWMNVALAALTLLAVAMLV